jgi:hypothetical protein
MNIIVSCWWLYEFLTSVQPGLPLLQQTSSLLNLSNVCMQSRPEHMLGGAAAAAVFRTTDVRFAQLLFVSSNVEAP